MWREKQLLLYIAQQQIDISLAAGQALTKSIQPLLIASFDVADTATWSHDTNPCNSACDCLPTLPTWFTPAFVASTCQHTRDRC